MHLVNWNIISQPKDKGGHGLRKANDINKSLLKQSCSGDYIRRGIKHRFIYFKISTSLVCFRMHRLTLTNERHSCGKVILEYDLVQKEFGNL